MTIHPPLPPIPIIADPENWRADPPRTGDAFFGWCWFHGYGWFHYSNKPAFPDFYVCGAWDQIRAEPLIWRPKGPTPDLNAKRFRVNHS